MDKIYINCSKCCDYIDYSCSKMLHMEYDEDIIKNIINSNYYVIIQVCNHKNEQVKKILVDQNVKFTVFLGNYNGHLYRVYNNIYLRTFGMIYPKIVDEMCTMRFKVDTGNICDMCLNTEQFINYIKKGTLIRIITDNNYIEQKIEQILSQYKIGYVLKKIENMYYIIDTIMLTKSAIK